MKTNNSNIKYGFFAVLLSYIFYLFRLLQSSNIDISMDELGTLANAGYYAGLDWTDTVAHTRYYGGGYYWIYFILFYLTENPYIIVLSIYLINSLFVSLIAGLIYAILTKYLKMTNSLQTTVFAVVPCAFYHISAWTYISNETPLFLTYWFLLYWLIGAYVNKSNKKIRYKYSFLSAAMLVLMLTVHERSIAVWGSIFFVILLFWLLFGERIVSIKVFVPTAGIGYGIAKLYKQNLIIRFWEGNSTLSNTSAFYGVKLWFLDSVESIKILADIFLTNFLRLSMQTYGIIAAGVGTFFIMLICILHRRIQAGKKMPFTQIDKIRLILFLYSFFAVVIIFGGLSVSWGRYIYSVFNGETKLGVYYRAYTYIRYYAGYSGGMIIATCSLFNSNSCRKTAFAGMLTMGICMIYYFTLVHNYFSVEWGINRLALYSFGQERLINTKISLLIIMCVFIVIGSKYHKKISIILLVLLTFSALDEVEIGKPSVSCSAAGASYKFVKELEEKGVQLGELYVSSNVATYQVMLNRYKLLYDTPGEADNAVVLSNYNVSKQRTFIDDIENYYWIQLDENEYVYIKGKLAATLSALGYVLEK